MSEFIWYVYQSGQQMGPFSDAQVRQLLSINMIAQEAFIFKEGWDDWREIKEVFGKKDEMQSPALPVVPSKKDELSLDSSVVLEDDFADDDDEQEGFDDSSGGSQQRMPRVGVKGRVIAHNDGQVIMSGGINISASGIFVETEVENTDPSFQVGEQIKLTVKADDLSYPFNVVAEMMRFNSDPNYPTGYGMRFVDLPSTIRADIERLTGDQLEFKKVGHG